MYLNRLDYLELPSLCGALPSAVTLFRDPENK